jgi:hypothetical protein
MQVRRAAPAVAVAAVLGLCVSDGVLVSQNARLRSLNRELLASQHVAVGQLLPPLSGLSPAGARVRIGWGRGPVALLVFEPGCAACAENAPMWRRLVAATGHKGLRLIAIELGTSGGLAPLPDPTSGASRGAFALRTTERFPGRAAALARAGLGGVSTVLLPSGATVFEYRLRLTPQTILLGHDGRVRGEWNGVLTASEERAAQTIAEHLASTRPETAVGTPESLRRQAKWLR